MTNIFQSLVLSAQARQVLAHMERTGSISAREAMADYGITSATLARRVCDLKKHGIQVYHNRRRHPITSKLYTRYQLVRK